MIVVGSGTGLAMSIRALKRVATKNPDPRPNDWKSLKMVA